MAPAAPGAMVKSNTKLGLLFGHQLTDTDKKKRGLYAVRVTGRPPQDVIDAIESRGGVYRPRDAVEEL